MDTCANTLGTNLIDNFCVLLGIRSTPEMPCLGFFTVPRTSSLVPERMFPALIIIVGNVTSFPDVEKNRVVTVSHYNLQAVIEGELILSSTIDMDRNCFFKSRLK